MNAVSRFLHPSAQCVVELRVSGLDGLPQVGSGYLVDRGWVLTAAHVVRGMTSVRAWVDPQVSLRVEDEARVDVDGIRYADGDSDWALLPVPDNDPPGGFFPVVFASVDRTADEPVSVVALGMPWFKLRQPLRAAGVEVEPAPRGLVREVAAVAGEIMPLSNARTGTLAVTVIGAPDTAAQAGVGDTAQSQGVSEPSEPRSVWEGMSGAAMWAGGQLVGVIAQHHTTEGAGTLTVHGVPETRATPEGKDSWQPEAGGKIGHAQAWWTVVPNLGQTTVLTSRARLIAATYQKAARRLAPTLLSGRLAELAELDRFASGTQRWLWYRAEAFAGKTALLAWWTSNHQLQNTVVVGCFLRRSAGLNTAKDVVSSLSVQLGAVAGLPEPELWQLQQQPADGAGLRRVEELLETAARSCPRLVLVIDGLDEYQPIGQIPAEEWLPGADTLPSNAALLVSSREGAPTGIPDGHPLLNHRVALDSSPIAGQLRVLAEKEIDHALQDPARIDARIVGFLAAAFGPLSHEDLAALIRPRNPGVYESDVRAVWRKELARTLVPSAGGLGYEFSHDALREYARASSAGDLPAYHDDLHAWAHSYAKDGWLSKTPRYLLTGYASMLAAERDSARLVETATDTARHARLRAVTGGDAVALADLAAAAQLLTSDPQRPDDMPAPLGVSANAEPDLIALARVTWHRDQLRDRNTATPTKLPAVWASLGEYTRAENLAGSITDAAVRAQAFTGIATALADGGQYAEAERVAATITDPYERDRALAALATAQVNAAQYAEAERAAATITDPYERDRALAALATALVNAAQYAEAERVAATITDPPVRAEALTALIIAWAEAGDAERVTALAREVEWIAANIANPDKRAEALAALVTTLAEAGQAEQAEEVARDVEQIVTTRATFDPFRDAEGLTALITALAEAGQAEPATALAREVERIVTTTDYTFFYGDKLAPLVTVLVRVGQYAAVERIAATITEPDRRVEMLAALFAALAEAGEAELAAAVAQEAERVAATITDPWWRRGGVAALVTALADAGQHAKAERVAASITNRDIKDEALAALSAALADGGQQTEAERVAAIITDPYRHAWALTVIAIALAEAGETKRAAAVAQGVERIAATITDPERGAWVLRALFAALAEAGEAELAAAVAQKAERLAATITDPDQQDEVLSALAAALIEAGQHAAAEQIAATITDPDQQDEVLSALAAALIHAGQHAEAERIAATITNPSLRAETLTALATALIEARKEMQAAAVAEQVEQAAVTVTDTYKRSRSLAALATALAEAGEVMQAVAVAEEAERIIPTITNPDKRAEALAALAAALIRTGRRAAAGRITAAIAEPYRHAGALTVLATAHAEAREVMQAAAVAGEAERIAATITDPDKRAWVLTALATALVRAGQYLEAERIATTITHADLRARALTALAAGLIEAADAVPAAVLTEEVERIAATIDGPYLQAQALAELATALAQAGERAEAERIAATITHIPLHAEALTALATALIQTGKATHAAAVAREAERTITDPDQHSRSLTGLATALVHTGQYAEADRIVATITDPHKRARALAALAAALTKVGEVTHAIAAAEEAERTAASVTDAYKRAELMTALSSALASTGANAVVARLIAWVWALTSWSSPLEALARVDLRALLTLARTELGQAHVD